MCGCNIKTKRGAGHLFVIFRSAINQRKWICAKSNAEEKINVKRQREREPSFRGRRLDTHPSKCYSSLCTCILLHFSLSSAPRRKHLYKRARARASAPEFENARLWPTTLFSLFRSAVPLHSLLYICIDIKRVIHSRVCRIRRAEWRDLFCIKRTGAVPSTTFNTLSNCLLEWWGSQSIACRTVEIFVELVHYRTL